MPLLDHFHPPLYPVRSWQSFHALWAGSMADVLNRSLPAGYFAEVQTRTGGGSRFEADVVTSALLARPGTSEDANGGPGADSGGGAGGGAVATLAAPADAYAPPAPAMIMPAVFPDDIEVRVYSDGMGGGMTLVGVVELVSPANKDRPETRTGFAAKCAAYLQRGVNLLLVDIVTSRGGNLHDELVQLLGAGEQYRLPAEPLYAVAYRTVRQRMEERGQVELWTAMLAVGEPLPRLPMPLDRGQFVPLDLEATYTEVRQRSRLP